MREVQRRSSGVCPIASSHSWRRRARLQVDLLRPRAATSLSSSLLSDGEREREPAGGSSTGVVGSSRR
jgi:hypothetical protein